MSFYTKMFLLLWLVVSCSPMDTANRKFANVNYTSEEVAHLQKKELESIVQDDLVTKDAEGNVTDLEGFEKATALDTEGKASDQDLREMYANEEKVFEFNPPEGVEAEFSPPSMVTGALLSLTDDSHTCENFDQYQGEEPTYKGLIDNAAEKNICGLVSVNFCIRMLPEALAGEGTKDKSDYVYTKTPGFSIEIPCKSNSFDDISISIADGKIRTDRSEETITISAISSVSHIYLTHSSGCSSGGEWKAITSERWSWQLDFNDEISTVYAKFRDIFGEESGCISDSIEYGSLDECFAYDPNYLPENILYGVSIGDIEGKATLNMPICTEDGQVGCIASSSYLAESADGLAAKVIAGQTVGGVAGTAAIEANPDCSAAGQEDCITTDTYRSMDLSAKDAGGAVDITSATFMTHIKTASTLEFWDETGARHVAAGDADITEANILNGSEIFGVTGTAGAAPDCASIAVGGTWILVPGNPAHGTNDFCVMKYEAKCSLANGQNCTASMSTESPTSTAASTPWVSIDQQDSKTECASLGKGYHLLTNEEWMTIATNAAAQAENWDGGNVGVNDMARGHSDSDPGNACIADIDDANAYVGASCTIGASGTFNQRRTHILSNGEVIWDLAGNVWEWTSFFNDSDKPYDADDSGPVGNWKEYPLIDTFGPTMSQTDLISQAAIDNGWNSSSSIGQYLAAANGSGGALVRGGTYWDDALAGVFAAMLNQAPTNTNPRIGFRCAVAVP